MDKTQRIQGLRTLIAVQMLLLCPTFVHAEDPPTGNADATDENVLVERKMILDQEFDPRNLRIYPEIKPILKTADQLPEFGLALRKVLAKKWVFSHEGIADCPTELTYYSDPYHKVACQTPASVIINPDYFSRYSSGKRRMTKALVAAQLNQNQRDLFTYELILGPLLGKGPNAVTLSKVLNVLTMRPAASPEKLQEVLESSGYGVFGLEKHCVNPSVKQGIPKAIDNLDSSVGAVLERSNDAHTDEMDEYRIPTSVYSGAGSCARWILDKTAPREIDRDAIGHFCVETRPECSINMLNASRAAYYAYFQISLDQARSFCRIGANPACVAKQLADSAFSPGSMPSLSFEDAIKSCSRRAK